MLQILQFSQLRSRSKRSVKSDQSPKDLLPDLLLLPDLVMGDSSNNLQSHPVLQVFALSLIQLLWINRWPGEDASYFRCLGEELCSSQGLESKGLRSLFHLLCDVSFQLTCRIKVAREPSNRCKKKAQL